MSATSLIQTKNMPSTEAIERLGALLAALTNDWQHRDWLLAALSENYPDGDESATRMLVRDIRWLRTLGFEIERSEGHHAPHFRLIGHARFGREVPSKFCKKCGQWRPVTNFFLDMARASEKSIYCRFCNNKRVREWTAAHPDYGKRYYQRKRR